MRKSETKATWRSLGLALAQQRALESEQLFRGDESRKQFLSNTLFPQYPIFVVIVATR